MKDFKTIVEEYQKLDFTHKKAAMATVVRVRGSSYRSPGARMLILEDGKWVGSISGGCLEGDALRKARKVMTENVAMTVTYDTTEESNQNLGIGLGCNGVIDVLIEPIEQKSAYNPITLFTQFIHTSKPLGVATIFKGEGVAEKMIINIDGELSSEFTNEKLNGLVKKDLKAVFSTHKSEAKTYRVQSEVEVFIELVQPTISVILFGGGFDARPVSQLAKSLGWEVSVTDECIAHIAPIFFPSADTLSLCERQFVDRDFNITPYTACVLMSHNYEYDRDVLKKLLNSDTPYIGILGPRKRFDKMRDEFEQEGIQLTNEQLSKIHSPIGLDIGAEAPDEITVSIIAEIQSKFSHRSGGFLKYRNGPIHQRDRLSDQVFKQVYLGSEDIDIQKRG
ncbi:MAG TPA: XdhC/CoxI family protein [Cyclobacteriaceae bacterium]